MAVPKTRAEQVEDLVVDSARRQHRPLKEAELVRLVRFRYPWLGEAEVVTAAVKLLDCGRLRWGLDRRIRPGKR